MKWSCAYARLRSVFAALLLTAAPAAMAADAAGLFQVVVGEVRLIAADGAERMAVKRGPVYEGDRIVTADGALAQIKFADGGLMALRANSEFVLDKFSYAGLHDQTPSMFMRLIRGGLRSITGQIGRNSRDGYRIITPIATIGNLGTDHESRVILPPPPGVEAIDPPGTYDKVNNGSTLMRTTKGAIEILPQQVGFVPNAAVEPTVLPKIPDFYRIDPRKKTATVDPRSAMHKPMPGVTIHPDGTSLPIPASPVPGR